MRSFKWKIEFFRAAQNLLNNPQLLQQIQQMQQSMRNPTSIVTQPVPTVQPTPLVAPVTRLPIVIPVAPATTGGVPAFIGPPRFPPDFSTPPPNYSMPPPPIVEQHPQPPIAPNLVDSQVIILFVDE